MILHPAHTPPVEFHLSNDIRSRLSFYGDLYDLNTEPPRPAFAAIQSLAFQAEQQSPGAGILPGQLFALAVLDQVYCNLIQHYRKTRLPAAIDAAQMELSQQLGQGSSAQLLQHFAERFSPLEVLNGTNSIHDYLRAPARPDSLRGAGVVDALVRLMLVYTDNQNPACTQLRSLYDDRVLPDQSVYQSAISTLRDFFRRQPDIGVGGLSLFDALELPGKLAPHSLFDQLDLIQQRWAILLPDELTRAMLVARDLIREDAKRGAPDFRPQKGETPVPDFQAQVSELRRTMFGSDARQLREGEFEPEQFSTDTDWMPRAVVIAKSVYVWLDQLSKKYKHPIHRLDQIPDEELAQLAHWGFSGLWLIGLWQRSPASKRIKHLRGNPDAVASAYSIYDYAISDDLGGQPALDFLRQRARAHGIRLASDLVPNHMGIDSKWLTEHPERFLQVGAPPYPAYKFSGPNLSSEPRYEIQIEDGYWDQSDAAVVFRLYDRESQRTRFVYHGNDGTSFPWNDTAQLDFLNPDTRETLIQLIVNVAKQFPILRFDAAMTLTKKHYQRLWYPDPGSGGAIPSRALFGLSRDQFDRAMPAEFWREVVDRIAAEAPATLLIAEAFWLTEGYFVRTLGMHRVYNSAFMNMLKHEENGKYRQVIRNTVEFDARILQRYVNFMNNPDEDTAVAQFGKGDKYFGVAVMMATLPGLPMFGHGQIEGLTEKYGHEYQRAYYDESTDDALVARHEREIFPLLRERDLFAGADQFMLYDLEREDGSVDDDVFVYSNRAGARRGLVVFLNRYANSSGFIRNAGAIPRNAATAATARLTLCAALGLQTEETLYYAARDQISGREFLFHSTDLARNGMKVNLHAYECRVLLDFRELRDDHERKLFKLWQQLDGRGVPNLEREFLRMFMAPLIKAFDHFCAAELLQLAATKDCTADTLTQSAEERSLPLLRELSRFSFDSTLSEAAIERLKQRLTGIVTAAQTTPESAHILTAWACAMLLQELRSQRLQQLEGELPQFDWLVHESLRETLQQLEYHADHANHLAQLVVALMHHADALKTTAAIRRFSRYSDSLTDPRVQEFLQCNRANNKIWFRKEPHDLWVHYVSWIALLEQPPSTGEAASASLALHRLRTVAELEDLAAISEYDFGRFMTLLSYAGSRKTRATTAALT